VVSINNVKRPAASPPTEAPSAAEMTTVNGVPLLSSYVAGAASGLQALPRRESPGLG